MSLAQRAALPADLRTQVSEHPQLAEQYRQVLINYQVADLLDARALGAGSTDQAVSLQRSAVRRRKTGDELLRQVLESLPGPGGPSS